MIKFLFKIIPETIKRYARRIIAISGGIVDPKGYGFLNLMFENAMVPPKYQYMFDGEEENPIFVDCGANVGLIIDIARFVGMEVYAFEPSKSAFRLLKKKYEGDDKIHLYQKAVSDKFTTVNFYYNEHALYDQSASLIHPMKPTKNPVSYEVESVRLVEILKNDILSKHKKIHLLKLDVEGAEFAIMEDIIKSDIYI
ncbi:MAG: FkbM family methyltransferase [Candidatus Peribacteria bacterium]|jgi:FkbM family methyltransferase|nr:FkbM family methyltransferase [Candidatus Peribacteria bacterium]